MTGDEETEVVATAHGEVAYKTVECSSCGTKLAKADAERFVIGTHVNTDRWTHKGDELEFSSYRMGWACEYCKDDPVGFPQRTRSGFLELHPVVQFLTAVTCAITFLTALIMILEVVA
jgi:hypothetical protein